MYVAYSLCFSFCHSRYPDLQLKFLYVAVTRARNNLWIVDSSESAEPMKVPDARVTPNDCSLLAQVYWSSKDQIRIWSPSDGVPRLAVSSTPEEWSKTGKTSVLGFGIVSYHQPFPQDVPQQAL